VPFNSTENSVTDLELAYNINVNGPNEIANLEYVCDLDHIQSGMYDNPNWRYPPNTLIWLRPIIFEITFFISLNFIF
jgi:hypothetical protein